MQWLFESFILGSSFSGLVFIVPDFGRKYPDEGKFLVKYWGCLGGEGIVLGGSWRRNRDGAGRGLPLKIFLMTTVDFSNLTYFVIVSTKIPPSSIFL